MNDYHCICNPEDIFEPPDPRPIAVEGCPAHKVRRLVQQKIKEWERETMAESVHGQEMEESNTSGSAPEQEAESDISAKVDMPCPRDTNGDGDCGQRFCPHCGEDPSPDYIEVYTGLDKQWHWRRRASNGQIVATGGEGYTSRTYTFTRAQRLNPGLEVRDA